MIKFITLCLCVLIMNPVYSVERQSDSVGSPEQQGRLTGYDSIHEKLIIDGKIYNLNPESAALVKAIWVSNSARLLPNIPIEFTATQLGNKWLVTDVAIPFSRGQTEPLFPDVDDD